MSFSLRENIDLLRRSGFEIEIIRSIGGSAKSDFWLQMKADIVGFPIERPVVTEASILGAAMLAAVGVGEFPSAAQCSEAFFRRDRVFNPNRENPRLYEEPYKRYLDLYHKMYV